MKHMCELERVSAVLRVLCWVGCSPHKTHVRFCAMDNYCDMNLCL